MYGHIPKYIERFAVDCVQQWAIPRPPVLILAMTDTPGQLTIAGFNGHGMPVIWLAAKGLTEMIRSGKSYAYEEVGLPRLMKASLSKIGKAKEG
jgi:hypothetical protein